MDTIRQIALRKPLLVSIGVTPTAVRKDGAIIKSFAPLKIKLSLEGAYYGL